MTNKPPKADSDELLSGSGRFPSRVIQATDGRIPDGYDGPYYTGTDKASNVTSEIATLTASTSPDALATPEDRLAALGPLPETFGLHPDLEQA